MGRVPCAFSCSPEFLEMVDARAKSLSLSRSAYIVLVLKKELQNGRRSLNIVAEQSTYEGTVTTQPRLKAAEKRSRYSTKKKGGGK